MAGRKGWCAAMLALLVAAGCGQSKTGTQPSTADDPSAAERETTGLPADNDADAATDGGDRDSGDFGTLTPAPEGDAQADADAVGPPSIEDFYRQLQEAVRSQDVPKAIEVADAALAVYPDDMMMQQNRIGLAIFQGQSLESTDPAAAVEQIHSAAAFAQKLRSSPDDTEGSSTDSLDRTLKFVGYHQGRAYAFEKKIPEALASLREAGDFVRQLDAAKDELVAPVRDDAEFQEGLAAIRLEEARRAIAENESFDFDFDLPDLDQASVKRSDFQGKILIVDLWGTWCPPCREEIPHFVQLKQSYPDDLEIVGIGYEHDQGEAMIERVRAFATEHGVNYPLVIGDQATQEKVPDLRGFPTTIFLDRDGKVRLMIIGYHPYEMLDAFVAALLEASPA